jgi:sigma-54 specific flagellar transcriptional regulator A
VTFTPDAFARMAEHGWPGNVRELRNFVDRANVMFAGRTIGADEAVEQPADAVVVPIRGRNPSVPPPQMQAGEPVALKEMLAEIERRYIEQALTVSGGVIADAARMLSLQRTTLIEKMRKYEMKAA